MLNPNAQKWVDALRSGKYKQGRKALTEIIDDVDFDCCLGVACKVAIENGLSIPVSTGTMNGIEFGGIEFGEFVLPKKNKTLRVYGADRAYGVLPPEVRDWLNLSYGDGRYIGTADLTESYSESYLTHDNDHGASFEEIANIIESEPKNLFVAQDQG